MDPDQHAYHLGGLLGNLQTLEMFIRLALAQREGAPVRNTYGDDFRNAPVGTLIPLSDFSNFHSLNQLIDSFNQAFPRSPLDKDLIKLRDALAHGRVFKGPTEEDFRIVKFSRPSNASVEIEYSAVMDEAWFVENKAWVASAVKTVADTFNGAPAGSKLRTGGRSSSRT
ncbi:hypothetical protein [Xanthomonas campestris]|uniref:hypothetical protein n=1 Tax=Xanthomonas campestris TaxID=339 RepID=UPI0035566E85